MANRIMATIGWEQHTTSRKWAHISVNGKKLTHRDARTSEWKTKSADQHASWVECSFAVEAGDHVGFEAGHNYGARGAEHDRTNIVLIFDPEAEVRDVEVVAGSLRGRLILQTDALADARNSHQAAMEDL